MDNGQTNTAPLTCLDVAAENVRGGFDARALNGLADSIHERGVLVPLIVRQRNAERYDIIAGQRRYLALCKLLKDGLIKDDHPVPINIIEAEEPTDAILNSLVENVAREDMHPLDEGDAMRKLTETMGMPTEVLAHSLGISQRLVQERIRLARKLSSRAREAFRKDRMTVKQAILLSRETSELQNRVLPAIVAGEYTTPQSVTAAIARIKPNTPVTPASSLSSKDVKSSEEPATDGDTTEKTPDASEEADRATDSTDDEPGASPDEADTTDAKSEDAPSTSEEAGSTGASIQGEPGAPEEPDTDDRVYSGDQAHEVTLHTAELPDHLKVRRQLVIGQRTTVTPFKTYERLHPSGSSRDEILRPIVTLLNRLARYAEQPQLDPLPDETLVTHMGGDRAIALTLGHCREAARILKTFGLTD